MNSRLIARSIYALDCSLGFLGYMYGIDHGHTVIAYMFLISAIAMGFCMKDLVKHVEKESKE